MNYRSHGFFFFLLFLKMYPVSSLPGQLIWDDFPLHCSLSFAINQVNINKQDHSQCFIYWGIFFLYLRQYNSVLIWVAFCYLMSHGVSSGFIVLQDRRGFSGVFAFTCISASWFPPENVVLYWQIVLNVLVHILVYPSLSLGLFGSFLCKTLKI